MARYEGAVGKADLFGDQAAGASERKSDIKGPLNILLVGIDPRDADDRRRWPTRSWCVHVPAEHGPGATCSRSRATCWWTSRRSPRPSFRGGTRQAQRARCRTAAGCRRRQPGRARRASSCSPRRSEAHRHQALRRRRDHQLQRLQEDRRRDGRRRHEHRRRTCSPSTCSRTASHAPAATRNGERLRRPAGGLQEGHAPPQGLAGAGLRPAALEERPAGRRLRPAAAPAAVRQGDGQPGVQRGRGDQPGQAGPGAAGGRAVADLQRPGQQRGRLRRSRCKDIRAETRSR